MEEFKKETIEEAIYRSRLEAGYWIDDIAFKLGAKWQQEQISDLLDQRNEMLSMLEELNSFCAMNVEDRNRVKQLIKKVKDNE